LNSTTSKGSPSMPFRWRAKSRILILPSAAPLSFQPGNRLPDVLPAQLEAAAVGTGNHAELEVLVIPLRLVVVAQGASFRAVFLVSLHLKPEEPEELTTGRLANRSA